ncbi:MAG: phosphatase PAP2 family protein [Acetobacterales bacterium]
MAKLYRRLFDSLPLRAIVERGTGIERGVLAALVIASFSLWGFGELADALAEGAVRQFDRLVFGWFQGEHVLSSAKAMEALRDLTALGSYTVLGLFTLLACSYLLLVGKRRAALFVLLAVVGGVLISHGLKMLFDRPRPELAGRNAQVFSASFPSGHSMLSAVVYLTLAALLARLHEDWRAKAFVFGAAVAVTVAVGFSRVLLGVHWPTDVLSGWSVGAAWASLCWAAFLTLQRSGAVEQGNL